MDEDTLLDLGLIDKDIPIEEELTIFILEEDKELGYIHNQILFNIKR